MSDNDYDSFFQESATLVKLDWLWLKAQAKQESNMDSNAMSDVGAKGLCQFMDGTWFSSCLISGVPVLVGVGDVFNPRDAIMAQGRLMKSLLEQFGDWEKALTAYNWGSGNLVNFISNPILNTKGEVIKPPGVFVREMIINRGKFPDETKNYYPRILRNYLVYRSQTSNVKPGMLYQMAQALQKATAEWSTLESKRIQDEIDFLSKIDTSMSTLVDGVKDISVSVVVSKIQGWL
jgi:membrane-bound lytic murein transglycosylase F